MQLVASEALFVRWENGGCSDVPAYVQLGICPGWTFDAAW